MIGPLTCIICFNQAQNPVTCQSCGPTYCKNCLINFFQPAPMECIQCGSKTIGQMNPNVLSELKQVTPQMITEQPQPLKIIPTFKKMELEYTTKICSNNDLCKSKCTTIYDQENACSPECYLLGIILPKLQSKQYGDAKQDISNWLDVVQKKQLSISNSMTNADAQYIQLGHLTNISDGKTFKFDRYAKNIKSNGLNVQLVEEQYVFRSALSSIGFMNGVHYWEILPHQITENEIKVGISKDMSFDLNTGFCDYKFGFAYYTVGSLRNGSNSTGKSYGLRFKNKGILGVLLDMDRGILAFCYDGNDLGVAFQSQELKKGPIYPAVAMLHKAGFDLRAGVPIPQLMRNNYFH